MKPRAFKYAAAKTVADALAILREHGEDAKIIAGGQSLMPMMNMRLVSPAVLVDIGGLSELRVIETQETTLRIGALARHRDVQASPLVRAQAPLLTKAVELVAHLAVRNRGTFGGSLCHADPSAEFPACALLLDAELEIASVEGTRVCRAENFFQGAFSTDLQPHEMLIGVRIPSAAPDTTFLIDELSRRQGDFAMSGLAAAVPDGARETHIVGFGCADRPIRMRNLEALLSGRKAATPSDELDAALGEDLADTSSEQAGALQRALMRALVARHFPISQTSSA